MEQDVVRKARYILKRAAASTWFSEPRSHGCCPRAKRSCQPVS